MHIITSLIFITTWLALGEANSSQHDQQPFRHSEYGRWIELFDKDLDNFIETLLDTFHVPGFSIAVVDGEKIWAKGYGYSSLSPKPRLATADTLYFTGSTTKAFTATIAAMLAHNNTHYPQLQLNTPIHSLIPEDYALGSMYDFESLHTTLEDAMSHRSGMPRNDLSIGWSDDESSRNCTITDTVKSLCYLPLTAEFRTRWQYSNMMYGVVIDVIEKTSGRQLCDLLEEWIWHPLGMNRTTFNLSKAKKYSQETAGADLARGYAWYDPSEIDDSSEDDKSGPCCFTPEPYLDISAISGAGSTISSVNDYALWIQALLKVAAKDGKSKIGPLNDESSSTEPLTSALFHQLISPRSFIDPDLMLSDGLEYIQPPFYSLGWEIVNFPGAKDNQPIISHGGGLPGFGTDVYMLPKANGPEAVGSGIITIGNTADGSHIVGGLTALLLMKRKLMLSSASEFDIEEDRLAQDIVKSGRFLINANKHKLGPETWINKDEEHLSYANLTPEHLLFSDLTNSSDLQHPTPAEASYAGIYFHPSYGKLNVTLATTRPNLSSEAYDSIMKGKRAPKYIVNPSPRTIQFVTGLSSIDHDSSSLDFFIADTYILQGPFRPDPDGEELEHPSETDSSKEDDKVPRVHKRIMLDHAFKSLAYFEHGPDGQVSSLGIQMEPEMVRMAREMEKLEGWAKGTAWRQSMIWFEKMSR